MTNVNLPPVIAERRLTLKAEIENLYDMIRGHTNLIDQCKAEIDGIDATAIAFASWFAQTTGERVSQERDPLPMEPVISVPGHVVAEPYVAAPSNPASAP